jgi:hypothetical protein
VSHWNLTWRWALSHELIVSLSQSPEEETEAQRVAITGSWPLLWGTRPTAPHCPLVTAGSMSGAQGMAEALM